MNVLVLNIGSSSLKAQLCAVDEGKPSPDAEEPLWEARVDWGRDPKQAEISYCTGKHKRTESHPINEPPEIFQPVIEALWKGDAAVLSGPGEVNAIGHRIVNGGDRFRDSTLITDAVRDDIREFIKYAPAHNRLELAGIEAAGRAFGPTVPQVAVFDTAFHATIAPAAYTYPGPYEWIEQGIRRFGFHGTSYRYVSRRATQQFGAQLKRIVACHLGNGCSLAAIRDGKSVDTTMGFTPLDGLMMGTRSGSVDPGILIHLQREKGCSADQLERMLNDASGLKGISGISGDMREIHAASDGGNARAQLAFDIFIHRLTKEIGAMTAVLEGIEALIFTAGIGENDPRVRDAACAKLGHLGIAIDPAKNTAVSKDADISRDASGVRVLVIHTEEDWQIALDTARVAVE